MADPQPETEIDAAAKIEAAERDHVETHRRAMARFDSVAVPQSEMRQWSLEDRRFTTIQGAMWEGPLGLQYENAPRPEVDKITKGLEKIELDYRDNRMMADFLPVGANSDDQTADTLDGMFRADAYHYKAGQAWDNAFQEACRGGMGAWRITTDYADPYDPENDEQRVNPGVTIVDADQSVYFDPASKLYDKSDAKWAFIRVNMMRADAMAAYEDIPGGISDWPLDRATWGWTFDWYQPDTVSIAEYYEVEESSDRLVILTNKFTQEERRYHASDIEPADITELVNSGWDKRERKVKRRRVHKYIMSGSAVLKDCGYIAGPNIPIVPVYGKRVFVDNMERFEGYTRKKKDAQRQFNASLGRMMEADSRSPFEVPVYNPGQLTPIQADEHARQNIDRLPFLTVNPSIDEGTGQVISAGPVATQKPVDVPATTASLIQLSLQILTSDDDNTEQVQANVSGEAMEIAKATVDAKSGIYIDNMRQSHQRCAEIYLGMAREVYYEAGRRVDTLTADGQDGQATLQEREIDEQGVDRIRNDLQSGKYKVIADVQEATVSRRAKTVKEAMSIIGVLTPLAGASPQAGNLILGAAITAIQNMDGEGIDDLQALARKTGLGIGAVKPTDEEQQEMEQAQAAQAQNQQPDPQSAALLATAGNQAALADKARADAFKSIKQAELYEAQAEALGEPEQAPKVPTGLSPANDAAQVAETAASARLKDAQAVKIVHDIHDKRIRTGAEIAAQEREHALAERQQDHAERQPTAA